MTKLIFLFALLIAFPASGFAEQSTITEVEGFSCMGDEKSRKETRREALQEAKRTALEQVLSYVKSETTVKNYMTEKDIIDAYSEGEIKVLEKNDVGWYKDEFSGDCFKIKIKAEVTPKQEKMQEAFEKKSPLDDPSMGLSVRVWTDKQTYKQGDHIRIYLKGNKPFFGKVVYKDVSGNLIQLLPNPYRKENYFQGGVVFELPSGNDQFNLEVIPPFGTEEITLYASSSPLGESEVESLGAVYRVVSDNFETQTRGIKITYSNGKDNTKKTNPAEFTQERTSITTGQ